TGDPSTGDSGTGNPDTGTGGTETPDPGDLLGNILNGDSNNPGPGDSGGAPGAGDGGGATGAPTGGTGTGGGIGAPIDNSTPTAPTAPNPGLILDGVINAGGFQLTLTLTLDNQLVTTRGQNLFSLPANAFDNGGVSPITVEVVLADGSALPEFVIFDASELSFQVDGEAAGEAGVTELIIQVTGSDNSGASATGTFTIIIVESAESETVIVDENGNPVPIEPTILSDDQASIYLNDIDVAAEANAESRASESKHNENSFFGKLDVAANEDNFENKVKQLLDDIAELIS
ncbi:MAG: hypothetical protein AB8B95_05290, partial [Pseudohongiellaceae bacterium]